MAAKKAAKKKTSKKNAAKKSAGTLRTVDLKKHCEEVRETLIALYKQSMNATHPVVQGTLREGFVRQVLAGFLGRSASWSSGQVVGPAPKNQVSGQMDLLLHDDVLPQVYLYDGTLCLVPHDALFGAIEVKSNLTTDKEGKGVLDQALDSLAAAMRVCGPLNPRPAFVIAAFYSGGKQSTIISKVSAYMTRHKLDAEEFWPDAIIILSGAKAHPKGMGVFRQRLAANEGKEASADGLKDKLWVVDGGDAIGGLVALLSKHRVSRSTVSHKFDFAKYIFASPQQAAVPQAPAAASASPSAATNAKP